MTPASTASTYNRQGVTGSEVCTGLSCTAVCKVRLVLQRSHPSVIGDYESFLVPSGKVLKVMLTQMCVNVWYHAAIWVLTEVPDVDLWRSLTTHHLLPQFGGSGFILEI